MPDIQVDIPGDVPLPAHGRAGQNCRQPGFEISGPMKQQVEQSGAVASGQDMLEASKLDDRVCARGEMVEVSEAYPIDSSRQPARPLPPDKAARVEQDG